jgi:alkanesulfonate monooxygenase SsuD/methylene tetrahydromethanopterin reductase-like flavin-dependent oxidoreductase (luciferase family)
MLGVTVVAADTDAEAAWLFTSVQQTFIAIRRGRPIEVPPPSDHFAQQLSPLDCAQLDGVLSHAIVGSPETVRGKLTAFVARTRADELILASQMYDHAARLRSYEIAATVRLDAAVL